MPCFIYFKMVLKQNIELGDGIWYLLYYSLYFPVCLKLQKNPHKSIFTALKKCTA